LSVSWLLISERKRKLGRTKPSTEPRAGHSCSSYLNIIRASLVILEVQLSFGTLLWRFTSCISQTFVFVFEAS